LRVRLPIKSFNFSIYSILGSLWPWGLHRLEGDEYLNIFLGVKRSRRLSLLTSRTSLSRLSSQYGIFNISPPYRTPRSDSCTFFTYTCRTNCMLLKILPFPLYISSPSVQELLSRSCLSHLSRAATAALSIERP
jgi:hypothetical protein